MLGVSGLERLVMLHEGLISSGFDVSLGASEWEEKMASAESVIREGRCG